MGQVLCCGAEAKDDAAAAREQEPFVTKEEEEGSAGIVRRLSRSCNPAYSWLAELGLERYAAAFVNAGFDDWSLLGILDDNDLALIEMHNDLTILPGHRKKLLLAAKQMSCKDPALAKRKRRLRRSRRSMSNRISPLQPGVFDLATSQLGTPANSRARKQLDAQNAALQRRASSAETLTRQRQQHDQQQIAPESPQSSPELPFHKGVCQGRYPTLGFGMQANRKSIKTCSSGSGSGNGSRSSSDSSVTITSASNAEGMESLGCGTGHNAHMLSQHGRAQPQQNHQHKEYNGASQHQTQQAEQPQSAQDQQPASFPSPQAEGKHDVVQAHNPDAPSPPPHVPSPSPDVPSSPPDVPSPPPGVPTPPPAMPLLTKQMSSGRRYLPMGTIPSRSSSRPRQNIGNAMPSEQKLAEPDPASKPPPAPSSSQGHGRPRPQRPSQRSPSPAASRRAEGPLPSHIRPAWENGKEEEAGIPRQVMAQGRPSGRKVWAAAPGQHAGEAAGGAAVGGHKRPWSCPSGHQQERQQQGQHGLHQQQQQQQQQQLQGGSVQGPNIPDAAKPRTHAARPLSPMHHRLTNVAPRSHEASPDQHQHRSPGLHRPHNSRSSSARSQRTLAVPVKADDETSPWNQDLALCIAGAAYVPKIGGQPAGSSNPVYEHRPSGLQQGWGRTPAHAPLAARNATHESEAQPPNPSCYPSTRPGHTEHLQMAGTTMQVSSNPAYAPSRGSPEPGREKRRRAAYVQTPPPPIQMQPTLSSSSSSSFASSGDDQTLDPSALAEIIGPDTIRGPSVANGRVGHSAQSVTLGDGIGVVVENQQQGGRYQRGASRAASPESRMVAQKLEAILRGLELKGFGRGKPETVDRHSSKRAELQQLHAQVEAQLERLRNPPLEANAQHSTPPVLAAGDPDLLEVEQCIAKKLNELEAQLAQG